MRWNAMIVAVVCLVAGVGGCKQQCFLSESDLQHYQELGLPPKIECDPAASAAAILGVSGPPTTVLDPERKLHYLTLAEAIATALEQGTVGIQSPFFPGANTDQLVVFTGQGVSGSDSIRVLSLDPAIVATNIEASLAKFDARWNTSMTWNTQDQPVGTAQDTFLASNNSAARAIQIQNANFSTALVKPLPTGGVAGITFQTAYQLSNLNPRVNPAYRPALVFNFEQPLLQGFGVEINQLRSTHPGSIVNPFPTGGRVEGILITRLRFDEQRAEFERNVNYQLVNIEIAYWNLYGSYWTLYSREQALRQAFEAWKINKARFEAGRIPVQDYAQTRQQYELFRGQRITALGQVLESERQIRGLMGMPVDDGCRLVPVDQPTLTPFRPDWNGAVQEAMMLRPELVLSRQELKFRQLDLLQAKNQLLPDLRFTSSYDTNAIGSNLSGSGDTNAFRNLSSGGFNNWSLGLQMTMPLGFRDAHALVRSARLNLARSYMVVQDQELKAQRYLAFYYRRTFEFYEQIGAQRAQREAAALQLDARFKEFLAGRGTLDILLEAQRVWADALRAEYDSIVQYNNALAGFQFAKGTIQQYDNIAVSEGPLPAAAQVRAVDHERERTRAIVLRERENPLQQQLATVEAGELHGAPKIPYGSAPTAMATLNGPPTPELPPETSLPVPRPLPGPGGFGMPTGGLLPTTTPVPQGAPTFPALPGGVQPAPKVTGDAIPGLLPVKG